MAERRRLPIVKAPVDPVGANQSGGEVDGEGASPQQPWHWVPLGALLSIAVGAVLSRVVFMPFMQSQLARLYGSASSAADVARIDAALTAGARSGAMFRIAAAAIAVTTLAVLVGGFAVGRWGTRVTARHGLLSGLVAMTLLVLFVGRTVGSAVYVYALIIPWGALVGWVGARIGLALRPSIAAGSAT